MNFLMDGQFTPGQEAQNNFIEETTSFSSLHFINNFKNE